MNRRRKVTKIIDKKINIKASSSKVWDILTEPKLMKHWMSETDLNIISEWKVGSQIVIQGDLYGISYENKGTILKLRPEKVLEYNYWSKLSSLPDKPENYSIVRFNLSVDKYETILTLTQRNFNAEKISKHSNFYWNNALELIKSVAEN